MRKIFIQIFVITGMVFTLSSCGEDFLDVSPKGNYKVEEYYKTSDQAFQALTGVYASVSNEGGWSVRLIGLNAAADECMCGGANDGDYAIYQAWNNYTMSATNGPSASIWDNDYTGIYRANKLLQRINDVKVWFDTTSKKRYIAEAKTLRAFFYFDLITLFKSIPLMIEPIDDASDMSKFYNIEQASRSDVYAQIEKDLKDAIDVLPTKSDFQPTEKGRLSKESAMALLGKVILYQNTNRNHEAETWFNKVNSAKGYSLVSNFKDIFEVNNKFNSESIWEVTHSGSMKQTWGDGYIYGFVFVITVAPRSFSWGNITDDNLKYIAGWSFNPVYKKFYDDMEGDPRRKYTISNVDSLVIKYGASYVKGYNNTGPFIQKYAPLDKNAQKSGGAVELNFSNNYIYIRLADTYLLEAEASVRAVGGAIGNATTTARAQSLLDAVRNRVGLPSIPATLDNIYNERKLELATEGHRWFDLVRTGRASSVLAFKGFNANKNEFLPIPKSSLNNTKLKQDPAYE